MRYGDMAIPILHPLPPKQQGGDTGSRDQTSSRWGNYLSPTNQIGLTTMFLQSEIPKYPGPRSCQAKRCGDEMIIHWICQMLNINQHLAKSLKMNFWINKCSLRDHDIRISIKMMKLTKNDANKTKIVDVVARVILVIQHFPSLFCYNYRALPQ